MANDFEDWQKLRLLRKRRHSVAPHHRRICWETLEERLLLTGMAVDYATLLGGTGSTFIRGMTTDSQGNVYLTGATSGPGFPTTAGAYQTTYSSTESGISNAFITKINAQGQIVWSTLYSASGAGDNYAYSIQVDSQGYVYIAGRAAPGLATTPGVVQPIYNGLLDQGHGRDDGFVAKFTPDGSHVVWSTYLGTDQDVRGIALNSADDVYAIVQWTTGNSAPPTSWFTNGFQSSAPAGKPNNEADAYVVELNPTATQVLAGTWISGNGGDLAATGGIALDSSGNVYVGFTDSSTNMPTTSSSYGQSNNGGYDFYLAKLSPNLRTLDYGDNIGGSGDEISQTHQVTVDAAGDAIISTSTTSSGLPVTANAYDPTYGGDEDIYVAKISPDGSTLLAATYLGGAGEEVWSDGQSVDAEGNIYVAFVTSSPNLQTTPDAYQSTYGGGTSNVYLAKLSPDMTTLEYGTYLGGSEAEESRDTEVDSNGNVYWAGDTFSGDFPTKNPLPGQNQTQGIFDGFLLKFSPTEPPVVAATVSPTSYAAGASVTINATASETGGTISSVGFYANGTLIGTSTTAPYAFTWNNVPAGGYLITAVATDTTDVTTTSAATEITVSSGTNQAPVIYSPAFSGRNDIEPAGGTNYGATLNSATTDILSVGANDDGGQANLTYSWSVLTKPSGAANPTFSVNNSGAASKTIATFSAAGAYTFQVLVKDQQGLSTTGNVSVTVSQSLAKIKVTAANSSIPVNGTDQITATAYDQFNQPLAVQPSFYMYTSAGSMIDAGILTAPAAAGTATIIAVPNVLGPGTNGSTTVTITAASNSPPTVATAAKATATANATQFDLSVLGADSTGESNLTYTWDTSGSPPPASQVSFSVNGTNAAKNTVVTVYSTGALSADYTIGVTISNPTTGLSVQSTVVLAVNPSFTVAVTPSATSVAYGANDQLSALVSDEFSHASLPAFTWSVLSGGGSVSSAGLYTAPASGAATATIQASYAGYTGTTTLTFFTSQPPAVTSISPTIGPPTGGTSVTITGSNFVGVSAVQFGGVNATSFTVNSATSITAIAPPEADSLVDITVTNASATSATSSADKFTYDAAPTVATAAAGTPNPVTGTTATLSALGADDGGESNLIYTWATTGTPPAAVTFSANGTNAAKNTTATFSKAGTYNFQVTITDAYGLSVNSSASVTVNQTLTSITVTPANPSVIAGTAQQFAATALDQFGNSLSTQPTVSWTVSGGGTINSSGLFTAGAAAGGPFTVTATSGTTSGTMNVTVISAETITLTPATTYQTIQGWLGVAGATGPTSFQLTQGLSMLVNGLGLTGMRLEAPSGNLTTGASWEANPVTDLTSFAKTGEPSDLTYSAFDTSMVDSSVTNIVLPFEQLVNARQANAFTLYTSQSFYNYGGSGHIPTWMQGNPGMYAEDLVSFLDYLKSKYGLVPNYMDVLNEADNDTRMTPTLEAAIIRAVGPMLQEAGLSTKILAAETSNPGAVAGYLSALTPTDWQYIAGISYHDYGGSAATQASVAAAAAAQGDFVSMDEDEDAGILTMYGDLVNGDVSFDMPQYGLVGPGSTSTVNTGSLINAGIDGASLQPGASYFDYRQIMDYVRPGAVRIADTSGDNNIETMAFENNGQVTTILINQANNGNNYTPVAKTMTITGLPNGIYGVSASLGGSTTTTGTPEELGVQTVTNGTLTVTCPADSVLTVYPRTAGETLAPYIWQSSATASGTSQTYLSSGSGTSATLKATAIDPQLDSISYTWSLVSEPAGASVTLVNPNSATATANGLSVTGQYVFNVTASNGTTSSTQQVGFNVLSGPQQPILEIVENRSPPNSDVPTSIGPILHLPTETSTQLWAQLAYDLQGDTVTGTWTYVSGPEPTTGSGAPVLTNENIAGLPAGYIASNLTVAGNYLFQLSATDGVTAPVIEDLTVTVDAANPATSLTITGVSGSYVAPGGGQLKATVTDAGGGGQWTSSWWDVVTQPTGSTVYFSDQTSPNTTFTTNVAGTYTFELYSVDQTLAATSNIVTINVPAVAAPTVTGISPTIGSTGGGTSVTITGTNFTAATAVQFGGVNATSYTVNSATSITAIAPAGASGMVDVTVANTLGTSTTSSADHFTYAPPPTVATPAGGSPSPVTGKTTVLSVLGADPAGESTLTYSWATTGTPPAVVTFSANGTNAAKNATATFTQAGTYNFQVTITDANGLSTTSNVSLTVIQTFTSVSVAPGSISVLMNGTQQFTATAFDQFGTALVSQPAFAWTVSGGGTINASGLFTAGSTVGGPFTVTASSGSLNSTASVSVNQPPTVATPASATPNTVTGTTTALSVLGADQAGEPALTYTWATTGNPPAAVIFSANGTNAAKNTTATFTKAGVYNFQVTITDPGGLTATSSVSVTVNPTLTTISISPGSASVTTNLTQQYSATALDQFGTALVAQPTFDWGVGGGGSINGTGLFTAGSTVGGPYSITASSAGVTGTASVTIISSSLALAWSTYLGGPNATLIRGVTTDSSGNIYITGTVNGPGFPTTAGAYQQNYNGGYQNAFVAKLNAQGQLIWSTMFGGPGPGDEIAYGIAVDSQGDVYIGGRAAPGLPVTPGAFQPTFEGENTGLGEDDGFLAKFSPDGSHLMWASYLGTDQAVDEVKVDASGNVYAMSVYTPGTDPSAPPSAWFAGGYLKVPQGGEDTYVLKISTDGTQVLAGTYLGGSGTDNPGGIGIDGAGNVYLAISTTSAGLATPNGFDTTYAGNTDFYLAKFNSNLSSLQYGTYIGGSGSESAAFNVLTVDSAGDAYIAMSTNSSGLTTSANAVQSTMQAGSGSQDLYVAKISPSGSQLLGATYLGGTGNNLFSDGLSVDSFGNIILAWDTTTTNLATTAGAVQTSFGGGISDIYLGKISANFSTLLYGSYLGGSGEDDNRGTAVDSQGDVYEVGDTTSTNFPVKNALQPTAEGTEDGIIVKFLSDEAPATSVTVSPTSYTAPATITLNATATDSAGPVASVAFYANGTMLGSSTTAPYSFTWNNVAEGGYSITAVATDGAGATTTSSAVEVTVSGSPAVAPVIVTPASSSPNNVGGTTSVLSVVANDAAGLASLTYTWSIVSKPTGAANPTFSANGTNAAQTTTVTYSLAGAYTFQVTAKNPSGLTATSSVNVTVVQAYKSMSLAPASPSVTTGNSIQITATADDQFGHALAPQPSYLWTATGGQITNSGLYVAGSSAGSFQVTATNTITGNFFTATITVASASNQPPTVATPAAAATNTVTGASVGLSVLGADVNGESTLTYTWSTSGMLPAPVTFGATNGTNAGKNTTATFMAAGVYNLTVVIADPAGLAVTSTVTVTIDPTLTAITVSPNSVNLNSGGSQQFSSVAADQFDNAYLPTFTWTIASGGVGTITSGGLYTAITSGTATVTATNGAVSGTAGVTVAPPSPPTVATPASATPSTVTATTTALSVLGADAAGEASLTYTWATTGTPPAAVTFSANGTNAAKSTTATFTKVGTYNFQVTITDANSLTITSSVSVTVNQTFTAITVSPANPSVTADATQQFTATALDQFGNALAAQPTFSWGISGGGSINGSGLFTAGATAGGPFTVTATSGAITGNANVTITAAPPPTVATAASATPNPVNGTTTALSVLGADAAGEASLTYTWATTGTPSAAVTFSANGTNAAKNTMATFTKAGTYNFQVTITDANSLTITSSVSVTVNQTFTAITVSPANPSVTADATQQFTATALDQFGNALLTQPTIGWAVNGGGTINNSGLFTAGATAAGPFSVSAASGAISGNTNVTVSAAPPPTVATPASVTPSPVTGTAAALSVLGADAGGEASLTYVWATTGTPPAAVTFIANGTNAAKNTTATFTKAGTYNFQVTITDTNNLTVTSSVSVTVNQTFTSITVSPANPSVTADATQQFTATALDQFGNTLQTQPTIGWNVSGGGTINASGLFAAGGTAGGPFTVTATSDTIHGAASATVSAIPAPTVATPAHASASPVTGSTTSLSVLGADAAGEANLTYSWATTGTPPAAVGFSINGTNAAKNTVATFSQAGSYNLQVTITNAAQLSVTSSVTVTVNQTITSVTVSPTGTDVLDGGSETFNATAYDQFGVPLLSQPAFAWSATGIGQIDGTSGLYSAPASGSGPVTVQATAAGIAGNGTITVVTPPTSSVAAMGYRTSNTSILLTWSGTPGSAGPIQSYNVYYTADGGASFQTLASQTTATSITFNAPGLGVYGFMSQAIDVAGNKEPLHTTSDTTVTITSTPWQNPGNPLEVLGGNNVVPADALAIIDYLNLHPGNSSLPATAPEGADYYDVLGGNSVVPADALAVIDYLNLHPAVLAQDSPAVSPAVTSSIDSIENFSNRASAGGDANSPITPLSLFSGESSFSFAVQGSAPLGSPAIVASAQVSGLSNYGTAGNDISISSSTALAISMSTTSSSAPVKPLRTSVSSGQTAYGQSSAGAIDLLFSDPSLCWLGE